MDTSPWKHPITGVVDGDVHVEVNIPYQVLTTSERAAVVLSSCCGSVLAEAACVSALFMQWKRPS